MPYGGGRAPAQACTAVPPSSGRQHPAQTTKMICTESWFPKGHWPLIFTSTSCFIQSKWIQWYKGRVMFPASPAAPLQNPTACNWLGAGRELPGNTWMLPECESQAEPQPPDSLGRAWAHQHHPHSPFSYRKPPPPPPQLWSARSGPQTFWALSGQLKESPPLVGIMIRTKAINLLSTLQLTKFLIHCCCLLSIWKTVQ